jgi:phenylpyruvate tautomerase PptA (4-oxalocrotonate tautomerase family)
MPFYRCYVPVDSVPFNKRQEIARAFTDIHCGSTGAPRSFVQVAFFNSAEADYPTPCYIDGGNRAGRPVEVREKLLADLKGAFVDITGVSADQLGGRITEGRASWSMEGGHVLPEPGEEGPEWFQHAAAD